MLEGREARQATHNLNLLTTKVMTDGHAAWYEHMHDMLSYGEYPELVRFLRRRLPMYPAISHLLDAWSKTKEQLDEKMDLLIGEFYLTEIDWSLIDCDDSEEREVTDRYFESLTPYTLMLMHRQVTGNHLGSASYCAACGHFHGCSYRSVNPSTGVECYLDRD